ncbi:MAG: site-specific integrase [Cyanobacteria bacterium J06635_15]
MPVFDVNRQIDQVNARLKAAQLGLVIERRGIKLNLRGTLPPRPESNRLRPHQQRIPLGIPATKAGLKQIEQQAKVIAAELIQQTFDWRNYLLYAGGKPLAQQELVAKIEAFHQYFLADKTQAKRPDAILTTWEKTYAPYLRKLNAIAQAHPKHNLPELIYATVKSTRANSRSRQVCCTALNAFANFLNLELPIDLKTFWGTYGNSQTQQRRLPTDEQILACYKQIPNPTWQFVYAMLATYGLRNHEVFFCDYTALAHGDANAVIAVQETTKTGFHEVWPFYPEWIDRFNLRTINLPPVKTDLSQTTLQRIGQQVSTQFRRYKMPFSPYDLRHAWAVRTIHMGLPDTVSARMMGHSVAVHNRTYHRWITHRDQQKAVDAALNQI